jgi:hypothetical protein
MIRWLDPPPSVRGYTDIELAVEISPRLSSKEDTRPRESPKQETGWSTKQNHGNEQLEG